MSADLADPAVKYATWLTQNEDKRGTPEFATVVEAYKTARLKGIAADTGEGDPTRQWKPFVPSGAKGPEDVANFGVAEQIAGNPATRLAIGAARPVLAAAQAVGMPVGGERLQSELDRAAKLQEPGVNTAADIAGQFLSPVNIGLAKAASHVAPTGAKIVQGATLGGMAGGLSEVKDPEEVGFWGTKLAQVGSGMTIGGAVGPLLAMGGGAFGYAYRNWIEPALANLSPHIRASIKDRLYAMAAGDPAKQKEVLAALQGSKEIVPGSSPTAGQAAVPAGSPSFAALQDSADTIRRAGSTAVEDKQAAAIIDSLRSFGKTPEELAAAKAERGATVSPIYDLARRDTGQKIWTHIDPSAPASEAQILKPDVKPVVGYIDKMLARNTGNPDLTRALGVARKGLVDANGGVRTNPANLISALDGIQAELQKPHSAFALKTLDLIKRRIEAQLPRQQIADRVFAQMSKPISEMEVGQDLVKKVSPAGGWQPGMPLQEKAGIKAIDTGFGLKSKDLSPDALQKIAQVKDEFMRNELFKQQVKTGRSTTPDITKQGGNLPNVLKREVMVMNAILKKLEGKISAKLASEVAAEMVNPATVGESLQRGMRRQQMNATRAKALETMWRYSLPGATQQVNEEAQ